jgi:hypothetical protein
MPAFGVRRLVVAFGPAWLARIAQFSAAARLFMTVSRNLSALSLSFAAFSASMTASVEFSWVL